MDTVTHAARAETRRDQAAPGTHAHDRGRQVPAPNLAEASRALAGPVQRRANFRASRDEAEAAGTGRSEFAAAAQQLADPIQRKAAVQAGPGQAPARANRTGLPDRLKAGIEGLSGVSMDDVSVHYGSARPAQLQAHAFAEGTDIHVAPGQERHLAHEAWHVVQQKQGRVAATRRLKGVAINDSSALEAEADAMGAKAMAGVAATAQLEQRATSPGVRQLRAGIEFETQIEARRGNPPAPPAPGVVAAPLGDDLGNFVPQDELMANGAGWQVVSDNSCLEFVTTPAVETAALGGVVDNMVAVLGAIGTPIAQPTGFQAAIGIAPVAPMYIRPYANQLVSGHMQGTVGIEFSRLPAFFQLLTQYELTAANARQAYLENRWQQPTADQAAVLNVVRTQKKAVSNARAVNFTTIIGHVDARTQALTAQVDAIPAAFREAERERLAKFKGMLILVGEYLMLAKNYKSGYAKKRFSVMSRTSFASMYAALSKKYQKNFVPVATLVAGDLGVKKGDRVFGEDAAKLGPNATFTVAEWFGSLGATERVMVPSNRAPTPEEQQAGLPPMDEMRTDKMTHPSRGTHATDVSMGSMGLDNGKVVVELRGLSSDHTPDSVRAFVDDLAALEAAAPPVAPQVQAPVQPPPQAQDQV